MCVRAKHLVACNFILHSILFDMQHDHILKKVHVSLCDPWAGLFWPQGYNLKKLGSGPLGDATYHYIKALVCRFRQDFIRGSYISL